MPLEGQQSVVAHHATTIVGDLDEFFPAGFDLDPDAGGTSIQRVLQQFLHHRCGTFHHFPCGDLVGNLLGKYMDAAHSSEMAAHSFADERGERQSWTEGLRNKAARSFLLRD